MLCSLGEAVSAALEQRGLDDLWWGARVLEAWPYAVGTRCARRAEPLLERSALQERGLLVVGVQNSSWMHQLSFLDIPALLNDQLGKPLVRKVRLELKESRA